MSFGLMSQRYKLIFNLKKKLPKSCQKVANWGKKWETFGKQKKK